MFADCSSGLIGGTVNSAGQRLANQCREPVTVAVSQSAGDAYCVMRDADFNQLPVVDDAGRLVGLVTSASLLRATAQPGAVALAELPLTAVLDHPPRVFHAVPPLPALLGALAESGAVVVVNEHGRPERIITPHDAAAFFRTRAQELLWLDERNATRQAQAHRFFQGLMKRLAESDLPGLALETSTDGLRCTVLRARRDRVTLQLGFSFTVQRTSRIDLHVDAPVAAESKRFFDLLSSRRAELEREAGTTLTWERLERARGCRTSLNNEAFISSNELAVKRLENWASEWIAVFARVVWPQALALAPASTR